MPFIHMENTFIENTVMHKSINNDGVHTGYDIAPAEGYLLHDNAVDVEELDPVTMIPTGTIIPVFKASSTFERLDYDFDNTVSGTYTYIDESGVPVSIDVVKIGSREFYAVPERIVPESQKC